jgi:hypothetical protein
MVSVQRVWFITVIFSPIIFWTVAAFDQSENISDFMSWFPVIIVSILLGFALSIPTMIVFYFLNKKLDGLKINKIISKLILSSILIVGILISFYPMMEGTVMTSEIGFLLPLSYITCALIALWFFSEIKERTIDNESSSQSCT